MRPEAPSRSLEAEPLADAGIRRLGEAVVAGQEEERRRLSRALHDGAGQVLPAIGLRLDALRRRAADPATAQELRDLRALVDSLLEDLRRLARDLRPAALDGFGLAEALRDLGAGTSGGSLEVEVEVDPKDLAPPPAVAIHLFRIAQSALANVVRHSGARRACVRLRAARAGPDGAGAIRLEVEDDGCGFDPRAARPIAPAAAGDGGGIGLLGMRERAAWLGGAFSLDTGEGRGTRVMVEAPLPLPAGGGG